MSLFLSARGMFVCDYNDNDRSSYRIFIGFEFQIQSNRSWRSERQIICAFKIEFPFSRMLFGAALEKTSAENKHQKLLSSSSSLPSTSMCSRPGSRNNTYAQHTKLNYDKPNAVHFLSIQKSGASESIQKS